MEEKQSCSLGRRDFLRAAAAAGIVVTLNEFAPSAPATAQTSSAGMPLADELVDATLKRLFGNRTFQRAEDKLNLELPLIAEDGGNVAITVDSNLAVSGAVAVNNIYIISDKNRRPMLAKFSFTPDSGRAFVSTAIRLATTTDVRAIAEMSDGTLYSASKHVRVTISGCDLPAQS